MIKNQWPICIFCLVSLLSCKQRPNDTSKTASAQEQSENVYCAPTFSSSKPLEAHNIIKREESYYYKESDQSTHTYVEASQDQFTGLECSIRSSFNVKFRLLKHTCNLTSKNPGDQEKLILKMNQYCENIGAIITEANGYAVFIKKNPGKELNQGEQTQVCANFLDKLKSSQGAKFFAAFANECLANQVSKISQGPQNKAQTLYPNQIDQFTLKMAYTDTSERLPYLLSSCEEFKKFDGNPLFTPAVPGGYTPTTRPPVAPSKPVNPAPAPVIY